MLSIEKYSSELEKLVGAPPRHVEGRELSEEHNLLQVRPEEVRCLRLTPAVPSRPLPAAVRAVCPLSALLTLCIAVGTSAACAPSNMRVDG